MGYIIFFIILIALLFLFSWLCSLDIIANILPNSISKHSDSYTRAFLQTAFMLIILLALSLFFFINFNVPTSKINVNMPTVTILLVVSFITVFTNELKISNSIEKILFITDISYKVADYHYFDFHLIEYRNRLSRLERRLSTLKSFSLLPIILILINKFPSVLDSFFTSTKRDLLDYGNIVLATISIIYFISIYQCYKNCQHNSRMISQLEQKRLIMKYPNIKSTV